MVWYGMVCTYVWYGMVGYGRVCMYVYMYVFVLYILYMYRIVKLLRIPSMYPKRYHVQELLASLAGSGLQVNILESLHQGGRE